jgi:hypothetical protein
MEALEAPMIFIAEKMRKFAKAAKMMAATMNHHIFADEPVITARDFFSKNTIGRRIMAVTTELIKSSPKGDALLNIRWSIV